MRIYVMGSYMSACFITGDSNSIHTQNNMLMKNFFTPLALISMLTAGSAGLSAYASSTRTTADDVITAVEGETVTYDKTYSGCCLYPDFTWTDDAAARSNIVFGSDNAVYFQDLLSMMPMLTYVKGVKDGNTISVTLPQVVSYSDQWGFVLEIDVNLVKSEENGGKSTYVAVEGENVVTFTVDSNGIITLDPLEEGYGIGLVQLPNNDWYGFMENKMQYVPQGSGVSTPVGGKVMKEVESRICYDLSGKQVSEPESGIFIRRTVHTDGTESIEKIAK